MLTTARENALRFGIDVVDVRVKRIEFSDEVSESVFNRMREERSRIAAELRAAGRGERRTVSVPSADRERTVILAEAYRDAENVRGEGDAMACNLRPRLRQRNPEFYAFYRSLEAYRRSLG